MFHTLHLMQHAHFLKYITVISPKAAPKGIYNCLIGDLMLASGEKKNETDIHAPAAWKHNKFKVCFQRQIAQLGWNQNTNFLPEASIGLRVLSSPGFVCVCVSVNFFCLRDNSSHVPARIIKFGPKNSTNFAKGPYCFWGWLTLTFQVKFNVLSKFCLFASLLHFEIFVRLT